MRIAIVIALLIGIAVIVGFRLLSNAPARRNRSEEQNTVASPEAPRPPTPAENPGPATAAGDPAPGSREQRAEHGKP